MFSSRYETGNHIISQETGYLKDINEDNPSGTLVQKGSYSYETPEGEVRFKKIIVKESNEDKTENIEKSLLATIKIVFSIYGLIGL